METYKYLLYSILKLINAGIIHFDIKIDNILYGKINNLPFIIDFGIAIPFNKISNKLIKEYFYRYSPDNDVWPLEVHVINFLLHKNDELNDANIQLIVDDVMKSNRVLNNCSDEFRIKYKNMFYLYLKKYENYPKYDIINQFLKYYKTWDSYSLKHSIFKNYKSCI